MTNPKIYVAGHRGMVGSAIVRQLLAHGHPADRIVTRTHAELDLTDQSAVGAFFATELETVATVLDVAPPPATVIFPE